MIVIKEVMTKRRVLLMYISEVSGHHQATLAIEKSLRSITPNVEILNLNGFGYTYPIVEKVVNKAYMGVIKTTPRLWDYLYDNPRIVERTRRLKDKIHKANHAKFKKLFEDFKPDVIACTQAFPCGMAADYKVTYQLPVKLIGILTDYASHAYWLNEGVDYYVVPCEQVKEQLIQRGVAPERVKDFGIPTDEKFTFPQDKGKIFAKLHLDSRLPVVLIMGGGHGLGPIKQIVKSLRKVETPLQIIVLAGKNQKLLKWLDKNSAPTPQRMIFYEFANNVEELMAIATVAITKSGGITTAEALIKQLPMVIVQPLPGQEMCNTRFLLNEKVAIKIDRLRDIGPRIEELLNDHERLASMREAALAHARPQASMDIAKLILEKA